VELKPFVTILDIQGVRANSSGEEDILTGVRAAMNGRSSMIDMRFRTIRSVQLMKCMMHNVERACSYRKDRESKYSLSSCGASGLNSLRKIEQRTRKSS